jgi:FkbM family methyltransferase
MDEEIEIRSLPSILRGVSVFVDVGASLGQYTHFANKAMQKGVIYAIEADPVRFGRLRELCEEWAQGPGHNRIIPHNVALSDQIGTTNFFVTDTDRSGGLFPYDGLEDAARHTSGVR